LKSAGKTNEISTYISTDSGLTWQTLIGQAKSKKGISKHKKSDNNSGPHFYVMDE